MVPVATARLAIALAMLVLAACGGATQSALPATEGVQAYARALRSDDPKAAWNLLAQQTREQLSYQEFADAWASTRAERLRRANELEGGLTGNPDVKERAAVTYRDGKTVWLRRTGAGWQLENGLISRTRAGKPEDALELFATALANRSYRDLLAIISSRRREGIAQYVDGFTASLLANKDTVQLQFMGDDRAEARWHDDGIEYRIVLLREGDEWRIDDLHIRQLPAEL